jgi:hypothetical protein
MEASARARRSSRGPLAAAITPRLTASSNGLPTEWDCPTPACRGWGSCHFLNPIEVGGNPKLWGGATGGRGSGGPVDARRRGGLRENPPELPLTRFFGTGIYPALFYQDLEHIAYGFSSWVFRGHRPRDRDAGLTVGPGTFGSVVGLRERRGERCRIVHFGARPNR